MSVAIDDAADVDKERYGQQFETDDDEAEAYHYSDWSFEDCLYCY